MITTITPEMDTTFTLYWQKYIQPIPTHTKELRKEALYNRLRRTAHTYSPQEDIPDHDISAYFSS